MAEHTRQGIVGRVRRQAEIISAFGLSFTSCGRRADGRFAPSCRSLIIIVRFSGTVGPLHDFRKGPESVGGCNRPRLTKSRTCLVIRAVTRLSLPLRTESATADDTDRASGRHRLHTFNREPNSDDAVEGEAIVENADVTVSRPLRFQSPYHAARGEPGQLQKFLAWCPQFPSASPGTP